MEVLYDIYVIFDLCNKIKHGRYVAKMLMITTYQGL